MTPPQTPGNDSRLRDLQALPAEDRAWLAALAGLSTDPGAAPHKAQGQALRQYFARRAAHEDNLAPVAVSEARMLQRLRQAGVLDAPSASAPARKPAPVAPAPTLGSRLQAVLEWLVPSGSGAGPRYALVASLALAVMVLPVALHQPGDTNPAPDFRVGDTTGTRAGPISTQLVLSAAPQQLAQHLQTLLQARGVPAQLQDQGSNVVLQAQVPPASRPAVQEALAPWGLHVPMNGALHIQLQAVGTP